MKRSIAGITLIEIMVACVVVLTAALVITTSLSRVPERMPKVQVLSNMRMLHMLVQQMALDNSVSPTGDINWTCRDKRPMTREELEDALVSRGYVSRENLKKYLELYGRGMFGFKRGMGEAFDIFAVEEQDAGSTLFTVTKNWHGFPAGTLSGEPYGTDWFVVFRKAGDGAILQGSQGTNLKSIGTGGRNGYVRLK